MLTIRLLLVIPAVGLVSCTASIAVKLDAGPDSGSAMDSGALDGGSDASADAARFVIAEHPAMPQVVSGGGPVTPAPALTAVTFSGYDQTSTADMFVSALGASDYWRATTGEYGVAAATAATPVHLVEAAPSIIDDAAIQTWLAGKLDGTHPELGTPTANSIYALFYPSTSKVTFLGLASCTDMGGYHNSVKLTTGPSVGMNVAYAVVPECNFRPMDPNGVVDTLTQSASHELVEAATDPYPLTVAPGPAWEVADGDHLAWQFALLGGEVADMCSQFPDTAFQPPGFRFLVQRTWSNASAAASHDPCAPALPSEVYFNAAPVSTDTVSITSQGMTFPTKGTLVALGQSRTIEVDLYSDGPMSAWTVSADDLSASGHQFLTLTWDKTSGQNGDKLNLTITPVASNPMFGGEVFAIWSTSGKTQHVWLGYAAQS